jgi:hypothetical protein
LQNAHRFFNPLGFQATPIVVNPKMAKSFVLDIPAIEHGCDTVVWSRYR